MDDPEEQATLTVGENFIVRRVRTPISTNSAVDLGEGTWSQLGGQAGWFWGLPGVFHALASPRTGQPVPAAPRQVPDEAHSQSLGYWGPLQYLLLYRLGWSDPRKGLMRWYDNGKPTDDPTLALVADLWERDRYLDVYLAWLLRRQPRFLGESGQNGASWPETPEIVESLEPGWSAWLSSAP